MSPQKLLQQMTGMVLALMFLLGCSALVATPVPPTDTLAPPTATPAPPTATLVPPSATSTADPFPNPVLRIVGEEEVVFDWTNDRCEAEHIPDLAARAFRDSSNQVQLITSHYVNYRMVGPDLNNLTTDCDPIMSSTYDPDPSQFADAEWIAAPYTEDGQTIYALVHNEYHGHTHPGQCPQNDYLSCWDNSITLAVSTDGGKTYTEALQPPSHLVARFPYPYDPGAGPEGFRGPSNIIKGKDGYYYSFFNVSEYGTQKQWVCLMRADDLSQPGSWRFWDGTAFEGQFANPYTDDIPNPQNHICPPVDRDEHGAPISMSESITFNTYLNRYVLVGISADWLDNREVWGVYYAFSDDLVHWTRRKLLVEIELPWTVESSGSDLSYLYLSLLDPESESRNFETTDKTAYLYYTRNNFGHGSLDRDLIRVPVEFFPSSASVPTQTPTKVSTAPFDNAIGNWTATDIDGSTLTMTIAALSANRYSVTYHDDGPTSCDKDSNGKSYPVDGTGTGTTSTNRLTIKLDAKCLTSPPSILGTFDMVLWYQASNDTISDNWGDTWNRAK